MRRALVCVLVGLTIVIGACSGPDDDPPTEDVNLSKQIAELDASPKVPSQETDSQSDRDPDAVTAGLWRLDPCRLLATKPGKPGSIGQHAPHRCTLTIGRTEIDLVLGASLRVGERKQIGATDVMGAKAYVQPGGPRLGGCRAWLPVSSSMAIRVEDDFAECWRVRSAVRRVVSRIDARSSRQVVPGMPAVETCPLLRHGLGSRMKGRKVAYGADDDLHGIDYCAAVGEHLNVTDTTVLDRYASLELETYQTQTLTFEEGRSDTPTPDDYASSGWPEEFGTIRGRAVFGTRARDAYACTMRWAESTTILELDAKNCAQGKRLVKRITKFLDSSPRRSAPPQSPLLYDAGDDDIQAHGACADYLPLWFGHEYSAHATAQDGPDCHPYVEADVPDDPPETVVAAEADPNVTCTLAIDAVREAFNDRLEPATLEPHVPASQGPKKLTPPPLRVRPCVFVDPQRKLQVQVFVSSDPPPLSEYTLEHLDENESTTRMPLGPANYGIGSGYLIGLGERPDDPGYVAVFVGQRQRETGSHGNYAPMKDSRVALEQVADAIVGEWLKEGS